MDRASRRVALVVGDLRRQAGSGGGATPHVVAAGSVSVMGAPGLRNAITWAGVGSQYFSGVSAQDVGRRRDDVLHAGVKPITRKTDRAPLAASHRRAHVRPTRRRTADPGLLRHPKRCR